MTETAVENEQAEQVQAPSSAVSDEQLVAMLVDRARIEGLQLTGEGGLLQQLTKRVLESALEGEITDHLGPRAQVREPTERADRSRADRPASGSTRRRALRSS